MSYTLHTAPGQFRSFKALIAAEYNGIDVTVETEKADASLSPTGKLPILQTPSGAVLFESNAIARYLAKLRPGDAGLTGNGNVFEEASIEAWVDFAASDDLEAPCCTWWYAAAGYMPFDEAAYNKAKADLAATLTALNTYLLDKTYLVGNRITLADICVVSTLLYPLKFVCDKSYLKPYGNVIRWFLTCVNQPQFKAIVGEVKMCTTELTAVGQAHPKPTKEEKKNKTKVEQIPKAKAKVEASAPVVAKKVEHPYKLMDSESPSPFILDAWKRTYSNATSYETAMETFWSTYDPLGWSIWHQSYNHNDENKRVFMVSNAIAGFHQRTDAIRKWAFGVTHVLGTEETTLEIEGVWLLRGQTAEHMLNANVDAEWYTWTKLVGGGNKGFADPPSEEVKARVAAYWCNEDELEGKPIQDSKVFK